MELKVSNKSATFDRKPHIKRGYYAGKLVEVKKRQREDGIEIEGKFGKQLVLLWEIYDESGKNKVLINDEPLVLASLPYYEYKNEDLKTKEITYRTAVTKNSAITKIFKCLGWGGPDKDEKPLKVEDYIGKMAILNIDDYDATIEEDNKEVSYKASGIKDVSEFEGVIPQITVNILEKTEVKPNEEYDSRIKMLTELLNKGSLTQKGYDMAITQLKKDFNMG
jgi:hypothetical protein